MKLQDVMLRAMAKRITWFQAAEILGIPYERCAQAGLFPIAYTIGTAFKPGPRKDLDAIVHWNAW